MPGTDRLSANQSARFDTANDDAVRSTADDALLARASAVEAGYITDKFIKYFAKRPGKRPVVINRGTYIRYTAVSALVGVFLERTRETSKRQILSLGCGCDTRPFLLRSLGKAENLAYFELDFPEITAKKVGIIRRNKELSSLLNDLKYVQGGIGLQSEGYCLLGTDLRTHETIFPLLTSYGFDPCLPTFVLAECFLVYLEPATAAAILDSFCSLSKVVIATYDPINPDDVFGRRMVENLLERGLVLPGFAGSSLDSHRDRLKIETAKAVDMNNVWDSWVSEAEKRRIDTVESLDEVEESRLLGSHYAVAWGARGTEDLCEAFDIESLDATVDDLT